MWKTYLQNLDKELVSRAVNLQLSESLHVATKHELYGVRRNALKLIQSFFRTGNSTLRGKRQFTSENNFFRVPPRLDSGPLLFLLLINGLPNSNVMLW